MAKCNLAPELREKCLKRKEFWAHGADELEQCRQFFENYLFCDRAGTWSDPDNDMPDGTPRKQYHCTACGERFDADKDERPEYFKLRHNDRTACPACGRSVTVKMLGRVRSGLNLSQSTAVTFVNVTDTGAVCLDSCVVFCDFNRERNPRYADLEISYAAKRRYYMEQGAVMEWRRGIGSFSFCDISRAVGWTGAQNIQEPFQRNVMYGYDGFGYLVGLDKLERSQLKYSAVEKYFSDYHNIDITKPDTPVRLFVKYLAGYALNNRLEMAVKLGMSEAAGELVRDGRKNARDIDWTANDPAGFARLGKADTKEFYKNPSLAKLRWYHVVQKTGAVKSMREADMIAGHVGFCAAETAKAAVRYGLKLTALAARMGDGVTLHSWTDYVRMGESLGYDFKQRDVLLPKNLRERHDAAAAALKIKGDEITAKKYRTRRKRLEKKYAYAMDGMTVVVPKGIEDIVNEGKTLKICVGSYADRHVEGKTTILFLRHERRPERSWLCIELDNRGELQQIRGYRNEGYPHAVKPEVKYGEWLRQWQGWYKSGSPRDKDGKAIIKEKRISA